MTARLAARLQLTAKSASRIKHSTADCLKNIYKKYIKYIYIKKYMYVYTLFTTAGNRAVEIVPLRRRRL